MTHIPNEHYGKLPAAFPNDMYRIRDKGNALYALGNYSEAAEYYDKALTINPNYRLASEDKDIALAQTNGLNNVLYQDFQFIQIAVFFPVLSVSLLWLKAGLRALLWHHPCFCPVPLGIGLPPPTRLPWSGYLHPVSLIGEC
jgi:tetratricopeptide (TPR) repeat protein